MPLSRYTYAQHVVIHTQQCTHTHWLCRTHTPIHPDHYQESHITLQAPCHIRGFRRYKDGRLERVLVHLKELLWAMLLGYRSVCSLVPRLVHR